MKCLLCGQDKVHKHGKTEKGHQRYKCPQCSKTFPEHFDTLEYGRHLSRTEVGFKLAKLSFAATRSL